MSSYLKHWLRFSFVFVSIRDCYLIMLTGFDNRVSKKYSSNVLQNIWIFWTIGCHPAVGDNRNKFIIKYLNYYIQFQTLHWHYLFRFSLSFYLRVCLCFVCVQARWRILLLWWLCWLQPLKGLHSICFENSKNFDCRTSPASPST